MIVKTFLIVGDVPLTVLEQCARLGMQLEMKQQEVVTLNYRGTPMKVAGKRSPITVMTQSEQEEVLLKLMISPDNLIHEGTVEIFSSLLDM